MKATMQLINHKSYIPVSKIILRDLGVLEGKTGKDI